MATVEIIPIPIGSVSTWRASGRMTRTDLNDFPVLLVYSLRTPRGWQRATSALSAGSSLVSLTGENSVRKASGASTDNRGHGDDNPCGGCSRGG